MSPALPYTDTKPVGHADFYFAVNATFRFILKRFGYEKLQEYWRNIGASYYKPVSAQWLDHGFAGVAGYWRAFFKAEPGAEVAVHESADEVRLEVKQCPAIHHLRENKREIVACFCQHCFFVNEAIAGPAGMAVRITGGNGVCTQRFMRQSRNEPAQKLEDIKEAT